MQKIYSNKNPNAVRTSNSRITILPYVIVRTIELFKNNKTKGCRI